MTQITIRQAENLAKKAGGPFSCNIDAPNGFYGLSTVAVIRNEVWIMSPAKWNGPDNFGGKRVPISVYTINGLKYHGTYFKSAGDYARIKRAVA